MRKNLGRWPRLIHCFLIASAFYSCGQDAGDASQCAVTAELTRVRALQNGVNVDYEATLSCAGLNERALDYIEAMAEDPLADLWAIDVSVRTEASTEFAPRNIIVSFGPYRRQNRKRIELAEGEARTTIEILLDKSAVLNHYAADHLSISVVYPFSKADNNRDSRDADTERVSLKARAIIEAELSLRLVHSRRGEEVEGGGQPRIVKTR